MPQANDVALTRLITVHHGASVEDPAPNTPTPGNPPGTNFDLHLEGVAGNVLGNSGATYHLTITAFDLTAGTPAPGLKPPGEPGGGFAQNFSAPTWVASGAGTPPPEFATNQVWTIPVPAAVSGHVFIYTASLVSTNSEEASFIVSSPFVLC